MKEMDEFSAEITKLAKWPEYCLRDTKGHIADGYGCSSKSYFNVTQYFDMDQVKEWG